MMFDNRIWESLETPPPASLRTGACRAVAFIPDSVVKDRYGWRQALRLPPPTILILIHTRRDCIAPRNQFIGDAAQVSRGRALLLVETRAFDRTHVREEEATL